MAQVALRNISKVYDGGVEAVKGISFDVADGEFVVLVGPSGCGKSTTLRMIAGLEQISGGDLLIGDKTVNDLAPKDRNIAMVFQNYALYPHMTVYDNMAFGLKLRKFPKSEIDNRVKQAAETLGLTEYLNRKPKHLSGGQRQRVAVGRAIVRKPEVFLFDEPLSNLDAKLRGEMRSEISRLHRDLGTTMIYVTHDQVEAMTMGDKIVILKDGVIQQNDTPMTLYKHPANLFVAGFIGSPPMNLINAQIVGKSDGKSLIFSEQSEISVSDDLNGGDVVLGIRPEDLHLDQKGNNDVKIGDAKVVNVEPLGGQVDYQLEFSFGSLKARLREVDPSAEIGQVCTFHCEQGKLHLFEASSEGERLEIFPQR